MSTEYQAFLATRPKAAAYDRWATRVSWMILPSALALALSFAMLTTWNGGPLGYGEVWAAVGLVCSTILTCSLLATRLVLAALRDAELDS